MSENINYAEIAEAYSVLENLENYGLFGRAGNYENTINLIHILKKNKIPVLGGGAYQNDNGHLISIYIDWCINMEENEEIDFFAQRSCDYSIEHLKQFEKENYLFDITAKFNQLQNLKLQIHLDEILKSSKPKTLFIPKN